MSPDLLTTRSQALRAALGAAGGLAVGGLLIANQPEPAHSKDEETEADVLNFALLLERVQAGFYAEGLRRAHLKGELRQFARIAGAHERAHAGLLLKALGDAARRPPKLDFGDDTADAHRFALAAEKLEDLSVAAYNSCADDLSPAALAQAGRIVSVEARHSAWIRDLRGDVPAPFATEPRSTPERIMATLKGSGYVS
jgi:Ferritin-like domain